ncbi:MAG: addiction module protein [Planctomycetales bacterium]|nr:addiction module protein [Planctomycetales bacterium]
MTDFNSDGVEFAWIEELARRSAAIEAGTAVGYPADVVFDQRREKFTAKSDADNELNSKDNP